MIKRKIKQKNSAVSEVLDTVLLLGIAVSLFSVLSIVVLTYPFNPSNPSVNIMGFVDGNNIILGHSGGEDLDLDTKILVTIDDSDSYVLTANDGLGDESKNNNVWNIGENVIINATNDLINATTGLPISVDLSKSKVDITVVNMKTNSVILTGVLKEGSTSTFYQDADGDGYGNPSVSIETYPAPAGYVASSTDCDDTRASVHPGATEVCGNGVDDDCDGSIDEGVTFYRDADGDNYGNPSVTTQACSAPSGYVSDNTDCNDANGAIHPGATEVCGNGIDDNCNGQTDEGCVTTGSITVIKDAVPDRSQSFSFTGTGGIGAFTLDDDGVGSNSQTFTGLDAGTYTVTETVPSGWYLTGINIVDPSHDSSFTLPSTATLLNDGFEGGVWDDKWDDYSSNWIEDTSWSYAGSSSARSDSSREGYFVSNILDTTTADSIAISFYYYLYDSSGGDIGDNDLYLRYYDGSNYDNIDNIGDDTEDAWNHYTAVITDSQYFNSNFRLAFDSNLESNEYVYIDDVLITKDVAGKAAIVLSAGEDVTVTFTNNKIPQTITLRPNAVGQYTNLGRHSGSNNYDQVDEVSSDGDDTYVYQASDGQFTDTYNIQNPSYTGTITQITVHAFVKLNSATGHMHLVLRTGTTDTIGTQQSLTSDYVDKTQTWSTNPATGTAWTWSDITSLQIGIAIQLDGGTSIRCTQVWVEVTYMP